MPPQEGHKRQELEGEVVYAPHATSDYVEFGLASCFS